MCRLIFTLPTLQEGWWIMVIISSEVPLQTFFVATMPNKLNIFHHFEDNPVTVSSPFFLFIFLMQPLPATSSYMDSCRLTVQNRSVKGRNTQLFHTPLSLSPPLFFNLFLSKSSSTQLFWSVQWLFSWVTLESTVFISMICRTSLPFTLLASTVYLFSVMEKSHTQQMKDGFGI